MTPTLTQSQSPKAPSGNPLPDVLRNGDRLTAREFHELYSRYPDSTKFELVGGRVFMASPLFEFHGEAHFDFGAVMVAYKSITPGLVAGDNVTVRLNEMNEVQPDGYLRIRDSHGGQSKCPLDEQGNPTFIIGAPELVLEISASSRSIDFGDKLDAYRATGVREYVIYSLQDSSLHWFELPSLNRIEPDAKGVIRSTILPGLWVSPELLVKGDFMACVALLQEAAKSEEHQAFVAKLAAAAKKS